MPYTSGGATKYKGKLPDSSTILSNASVRDSIVKETDITISNV
jgi:hypothetical protein